MAGKKWKFALSNLAISLYDRLSGRRIQGPGAPLDGLNPDSIAIFSTTALGDFMFNTPAIRALRQRFPHARLTLVSSHKNRTLVEQCPLFARVIYWDQKVGLLPSVARQLRQDKPQLAVLLHSKAPYDVLCAVFAGAKYIVRDNYGRAPSGMERWLADYSRAFDGHLIERKLALVARLGCDVRDNAMFVPTPFTPVARVPGEVTVGFQLGASEALRSWPVARFVELARRLFAAGAQYRVALIGSPKETALADAFLQALTDAERERVANYVGGTTLPELLARIDSFDVLVTGDTGPLHLAVALRTRTISLFATANPQHTGPLQDPELHQVIQVSPNGQAQPLAAISADEVMAKIAALA